MSKAPNTYYKNGPTKEQIDAFSKLDEDGYLMENQMDKATPNWRGMSDDEGHGIYDENGKWIAHVTDQKHTEKIVKAVNRDHLFDELVEQVEVLSEELELRMQQNLEATPNNGNRDSSKNDSMKSVGFNILLRSLGLLQKAKAAK